MKKRFFSITLMVATVCSTFAAVTLDEDLRAALPNGEYVLPAPPEVGSLIWQDDSVKYFEYKQAGNAYDSVRQEYWDSAWASMNEQYYFALYRVGADSVMNAPFLSELSWAKQGSKYTVTYVRNMEDFPQMNALEELCEAMKTENTSNTWRTRPRPYYYFGWWYKGKKYTVNRSDVSSYPSGHGYFAGLFGMCLLYIDPDHALEIKNMMDEWLHCRLLLGAHWNTDLAAGQQLGAMAFAIAMNHDQFRDLVLAAKAELEAYRAAHPEQMTATNSVEQPSLTTGKTWQNGQLLIHHNDATYDARGTRTVK